VPKKSKHVQAESESGVRSPTKKGPRKKSQAKGERPRKSVAAKSSRPLKPIVPTDEQIRIRAYFIAEKRAQHSIKGDHHGDWLEARRQLLEELGLPSN
jgi:hypothetical protein